MMIVLFILFFQKQLQKRMMGVQVDTGDSKAPSLPLSLHPSLSLPPSIHPSIHLSLPSSLPPSLPPSPTVS